MSVSSSSGKKGLALDKRVAPEREFLPRTIEFSPATSSSNATAGGATQTEDSEQNGPTPAYYLYPRDKVFALFQLRAARKVGRGLRNAGNTCFFNSVLQVLTHTLPLQNYLMSGEHTSSCKAVAAGNFCALCLLAAHAREAFENTKAAVHPKAMLKRLQELGGRQMRLGRQEDAHEFLRQFLHSCDNASLKPAVAKNKEMPLYVQRTTLVQQLFGGYLRSQVLCLDCGYQSNTFDPIMDLSLEVAHASTIERALEGFTKAEKIAGATRYRCQRCQSAVDATKRFSLHLVPPVLTFQLKRFDYNQGYRGKIEKHVVFKTMLDMAPFTCRPEEPATYRLYGVIVHRGHSTRSGHYFAYARHATGAWYQFNDDVVTAVSEQTVLKSQAYLLFYERIDLPKPPSPVVAEASSSSSVPAAASGAEGQTSRSSAELQKDLASKVAALNSKVNGSLVNGRAVNGHSAPGHVSNGCSAASVSAPKEHVKDVHAAPAAAVALADSVPPAKEPPAAELSPMESDDPAVETSARSSSAAAMGPGSAALAVRRRRSRGLALLKRLQKKRRHSEIEPQQQQTAAPGDDDDDDSQQRQPQVVVSKQQRRRRAVKRRIESDSSEDEQPDEMQTQQQAPPAPPANVDGEGGRRCQEPAERTALAGSCASQFGLAKVDRWDDDSAAEGPGAAFEEAQRRLQPAVGRRDDIDKEYDVGKRKHKPKKEKTTFEGKSAFDREQQRRASAKSGARTRFGDSHGRPAGKGSKGKGKGKGKHGKAKGKGK